MGQSATEGRRLLPLLWQFGDTCDVRGARGRIVRIVDRDALVDVDGLRFWVASSALELVALPAEASS